MVAENVYIAIITIQDYYNSTRWNDVIAFFNTKYPNNNLVIENYFVDTSPVQTISSIQQFITNHPSGKRAIISNYSSVVKEADTYCRNNNIDIINVSPGANSNIIKTLNNTLTYAPYNKYSVMAFFQIFMDYNMKEIKILCEKNIPDGGFYKTILDEIVAQANLLGVKYSINMLSAGVSNYNIKKKSAIFILSDSEQLKNTYVTPAFLENIPRKCFFALSESYYEDIFGRIPALVFFPFPINFTTTSKEVYDAIIDKTIIYYTIFSLYDILFVLSKFSINNLPLTKDNYINYNAYGSSSVPAAMYNNYLDATINGAPYGKYQVLYTKNVIIDADQSLFLQHYRGGQLSLPNSYSIFKNVGLTPNNNSLIEYDEAHYYKIYKNNTIFIVGYSSNITEIIIEDGNISNGIVINTKFIYEYNSDGYFSTLKRVIPYCCKFPKVNSTMSKKIIKLIYNS